MSTKTEKDTLRKQIYERMNFKETNELLEIWRKGDHEEWTEIALDVIKEILIDRLGEIPPEEDVEEKEDETVDINTTTHNEDIFHNENKLLNISSWASTLSWIVLGLYMVLFVIRLILEIQNGRQGVAINLSQINAWLGLLSMPIIGSIYFLILQAISEGIYMLMDLEDDGLQIIKSGKR